MSGGYIDIERDVKIEIVDPDKEIECAYSIGIRPATRLPEFTEEEIRAELGDEVVDRIVNIFADIEE